jgi:hypothetical protein
MARSMWTLVPTASCFKENVAIKQCPLELNIVSPRDDTKSRVKLLIDDRPQVLDHLQTAQHMWLACWLQQRNMWPLQGRQTTLLKALHNFSRRHTSSKRSKLGSNKIYDIAE